MNNQAFYNTKNIAKTSQKGYYQEKINFFITTLKKLPQKSAFLDIACNDGKLTQQYARYGNVIGIDINERAIRECKKKGLQCFVAEINDIEKKYKESFDVVIAGDIIEHIFDTDKFLAGIYAVLKKGGILLLTTPNLASLGRRAMLLFGKNPFVEYSTKLPYEEFNVGHIRYYTKANLFEQLSAHSFQEIHIFGDKINITKSIAIPPFLSSQFPTISRNLMVSCKK
jgi:2-polyprenyl-3-methyl-5-hydroxy-6-metoxy-1,4-benzoquinol methylase